MADCWAVRRQSAAGAVHAGIDQRPGQLVWRQRFGGSAEADALQRFLGLQHARWLVYLAALIPLGAGIAHLVRAWRAKFERYFQCDEQTMRVVRPISRIGLAARGCVLLIIAALLLTGGSRYSPTDPPGSSKPSKRYSSCPPGKVCCWQLQRGCSPSRCTASPKPAGGESICRRCSTEGFAAGAPGGQGQHSTLACPDRLRTPAVRRPSGCARVATPHP